MSRRLAASVAGAAVVLAVAVGVLVTRDDAPSRSPSPAASGPAERRACAHVDRFLAVVRANGPASDAIAELGLASDAARAAAAEHPRWIALSGAVDALRAALLRDDRVAADLGTRVVRAECAKVASP